MGQLRNINTFIENVYTADDLKIIFFILKFENGMTPYLLRRLPC